LHTSRNLRRRLANIGEPAAQIARVTIPVWDQGASSAASLGIGVAIVAGVIDKGAIDKGLIETGVIEAALIDGGVAITEALGTGTVGMA